MALSNTTTAIFRRPRFCWYRMLWSAVTKTSKPAASAASSNSPFLSRSHPYDLHSFTAWPRKERAIALGVQLSSKTRIQKLLTGTSRLRAANSSTALISSRETGNCSMISSMVIPCSRFSNTTETGVRLPLNNHAPLTLPGILSTAGHCDQSKPIVYRSTFQRYFSSL